MSYQALWNSIRVVEWPSGKRVSFTSSGCGCCSDTTYEPFSPEALKLLKEQEADLVEGLEFVRGLIAEIEHGQGKAL